jgi:hypothetical protein
MGDIIDLKAIRVASDATKQAARQVNTAASDDRFEALVLLTQKLAGLAAQLGETVVILEKTATQQAADIARLTVGFAALARILSPVGGSHENGE